MAGTPIPLTTDGTGPAGAIPVTIAGLESSTPEFSDLQGSVAGVTGSDLQAILNSLASRIAAVETP